MKFYLRQFFDRSDASDSYACQLILCFIFLPWDTAWNCVWSPISQAERREKMGFKKHDFPATSLIRMFRLLGKKHHDPLKIIADMKEKLMNDPSGIKIELFDLNIK